MFVVYMCDFIKLCTKFYRNRAVRAAEL